MSYKDKCSGNSVRYIHFCLGKWPNTGKRVRLRKKFHKNVAWDNANNRYVDRFFPKKKLKKQKQNKNKKNAL